MDPYPLELHVQPTGYQSLSLMGRTRICSGNAFMQLCIINQQSCVCFVWVSMYVCEKLCVTYFLIQYLLKRNIVLPVIYVFSLIEKFQ